MQNLDIPEKASRSRDGMSIQRSKGVTWAFRAPFVLLPRRSRSYSAWHISPVIGGNPDRLDPAVEVSQRPRRMWMSIFSVRSMRSTTAYNRN